MAEKAWQAFFNVHCSRYDSNCFTCATDAECSFLEELIPKASFPRVIDIGCGTGRHSVNLALRGYDMTGVDLSEGMLDVARRKAEELGANVRFIHADATGDFPSRYSLEGSFDAAICLCEGSLGLIGAGEDPFNQALAVFGNVQSLLRKGGTFVFTALNALRHIRKHSFEDILAGRFDPFCLIEWNSLIEVDPQVSADIAGMIVGEKSFTGGELRILLDRCGLDTLHMWGGTAGAWGRRPLDPDEYEIMVIAYKK